ncbi:MAG TPA: deoxyribose-phosphate aldolase, partial [Pseudogracilibacillus sp.]|nr:deoxyribose-phosphate aldolase [Pseudogracilibacillus sp.]
MSNKNLAKTIDHTLLKADSRKEEVETLCKEAREYNFATVCVNPYWVKTASELLDGSDVGVTTVIGFPLGASTSAVKAAETRDAIKNGATEVDMVMNIGAFKSGDEAAAVADMKAVVGAAAGKAVVKVILETGFLNAAEIEAACVLAKNAGVDFVKTSTGFGPGAATIEAVEIMRKTVGADIGVKASGGVRDRAAAEAMIAAGATRIGASAGIAIVTG